MADEVSSIGVRLTLDASGFVDPLKEASGALNTFQRQAAQAGSGVTQGQAGGAGGKKTVASSTTVTGVNVSLSVNAETLTKLRTQITAGLGAIPVTITPRFAMSGPQSLPRILGGMLSMQYGLSPAGGHELATRTLKVYNNLYPTRAHGGPVQQGRPTVVGERRAEVFVPQTHGMIQPDAQRFYREQERLRRLEMELATLEATRQRQHEREMGRIRGGGVRGYGGKYGSSRPATVGGYRDFQNQLWGEVSKDPGRLFHATDMLPEIRGQYRSEYGTGVYPNSPVYGGGRGSFWSEKPLTAYKSTSLLRTRQTGQMRPMFGGVHSEAANEYFVSPDRVPLRRLQYWGDDNDWHKFRRGRARMSGGPTHAWRGATARAYYQTINPEIRGGTFPVDPRVPVPDVGHAVGISRFLAQQTGRPIETIKVDPTDPVAFMRAFHAMKKAGAPYVGTWWPEGQPIDVDPSTVIRLRREANLVAAFGHEKAGYALRKTPAHPYGFEWPTRNPGFEAEASRVAEIIYGKKRQGGGPVFELEGMAPFLKGPVQGTVERLLGQYPMVGEHLTRVQMSRGFPPYAAYESSEGHGPIPATPTRGAQRAEPDIPGTLHISAQSAGSYGARDYYTSTGAMRKDKGFHVPGTSSIVGNVTHEFGHALRRHIEQTFLKTGGLPQTAKEMAELEELLKVEPKALRGEPGYEKFYGISPYAEQARTMPWFMGGGAFEPWAEIFSGMHTPGGKTHTIPAPMLDRMSRVLTNLKLGRSRGGIAHAAHGVQFDLQGMRGDLRSRVTDTIERLLDKYPMIGASPYAPGISTAAGQPTLGYVGMSGREPYAEYGHPLMAPVPGSRGYGGLRYVPGIMNFSMEAFGRMPRGSKRPGQGNIYPPLKAWWADPMVSTSKSRSDDYFNRKGELIGGDQDILVPGLGGWAPRSAQFSPGTATAEGIATHEFGHAVDWWLQTSDQSRSFGKLRPDDPYSPLIPTNAEGRHLELTDILRGKAADSISGYAASARLKPRAWSYVPRDPRHGDPAEPFADLFAALETPGATTGHVRPKKMVTSMREILEELSGRRMRGGPVHAMGGAIAEGKIEASLTRRQRSYTGNLREQARRLQPSHIIGGKAWYPDAHQFTLATSAAYGVPENVVRGMLAVLSAGTEWKGNKTKLTRMLDDHLANAGERYDRAWNPHAKAYDILNDWKADPTFDPWDKYLKHTPKTGQFYLNTGGNLDALTIDRWAIRTATRRALEQLGQGPARRNIARSYKKVAGEYGMKPAEFQAALWLLEKETPVARTRKKAEGGFVQRLMGEWEPWMGYQMAQEAMQKRKEAKHAAGGAFTALGHGAHTPFGEEFFHFLPDVMRGPFNQRTYNRNILRPSKEQLEEIDKIRGADVEHGLVIFSATGGGIRRHVVGTPTNVSMGDTRGQYGIHNHPGDPGLQAVRPSNMDVRALFAGEEREGWVVTPEQTSIMRTPEWMIGKKGASGRGAAGMLAPQAYLEQSMNALDELGLMSGQLKTLHGYASRTGDTDAFWNPFLRLINSPEIAANNDIWDRVYANLGGTTGMEYLRFPASMHGLTHRPKGMDPETWKRFPTMSVPKVFHMAGGGDAGGGLYIVGEIGPELFVPNRLRGLIPQHVMEQIPKAASGLQVIGQKRNSLFAPPEDGVIIPHRLMDQIPHAQEGVRDTAGRFIAGNPFRFNDPSRTGGPIPVIVQNVEAFATAFTRAMPSAGGGGTEVRMPLRAEDLPPEVRARLGLDEAAAPTTAAGRPRATRPLRYTASGVPAIEMIPGVAPGPRAAYSPGAGATAGLTESRAAEFAQARQQLSFSAQSQAARTPRGMAAVLGAQFFGGRETSLETIAAQRRALSGLEQIENQLNPTELASYRDRLDDLTLARHDERAAIDDDIKTREAGNPKLKEWNEANKEYQKTIQKGLPGLGATARNFAGIMVGVQAYSMAMQAVGFAMEAAMPAAEKWVDEMFGWQAQATKTTNALGEALYASRGNLAATMSQTAVNAGLSASMMDYVGSAVAATATAKAGAKAQQETSDLFRTTLSQKRGAAPEGLFGGYGGVLGSALFGGQMGGGKGFTEIIAGDVGKLAGRGEPRDVAGSISTGLNFLTNETLRNYVLGEAKKQGSSLGAAGDVAGGLGDVMRAPGELAGQALTSGNPLLMAAGAASLPLSLGSMAFGAVFGKTPAAPGQPGGGPWMNPAVIGKAGIEVEGLNNYLKDLESASERGAEASGHATVGNYELASSQEEIDKATRTAILAGDEYGIQMAQQGIVLKDTKDRVIESAEAYKQAALDMAKGKTILEPGAWAAQSQRALLAQRQAGAMQTERTINVELPFEMTKQLLGQPIIAPGAGFFPGAIAGKPSAAAAGLSAGAAGMAQGALAESAGANLELQRIASEGLSQARADIAKFTPENLGKWDTAVTQSQDLSAGIAKLTTNMARLNQAASQASWANQIRLASRALGDALGMLGRVGGTRLGQLQREQWMVSRASQQLGLQLQQRQITTQLAIAQFQAPGETGEERYMRQKEALVTADIGQKQLGFSWQEFTISGSIWKENAERAATDAGMAIDVMQKARNAEGYTIAAQEAVAKKQQLLAQTMGRMDAMFAQSRGNWGAALNAATQGIGEFAGSLDVAVREIYKTLGYSVSRDKNGNLVISGSGLPGGGGNARGIVGLARGQTQAIMGEAGDEAVAILRNPRMGSFAPDSGGGGSSSVVVNVNGPVVRNDQDISSLARAVAAEVERTLSRKGQLLGLRSPAY